MFLYYFLSGFSSLILLITVLVVSIILLVIIYRRGKNFWLKPVYSVDDALNELFALASIILFNLLAWKIFFEVGREASFVGVWPFELMFLGTVLVSLGYSVWVKAYLLRFLSIMASYLLVLSQIIRWGLGGNYKVIDSEVGFVPVAGMVGLGWLALNLLYPLAKYFLTVSRFKKWARTANLLRTAVIFMNVLLLGFLSSFMVAKNWQIWFFRGSENIWSVHWLMGIIGLLLIALAATVGYAIYQQKIRSLKLSEFVATIIPPVLFGVAGVLVRAPSRSSFGSNLTSSLQVQDWLWLIIFNTLFFGYLVYLVIKSGRCQELWLKIYSIMLLVVAIFYKFFDSFSSFTFRGVFFMVFGAIIMFLVLWLQRRYVKDNKE